MSDRSYSPPRGWSAVSLADVTTINPGQVDSIPRDEVPVTFLRMAAVEAMTNRCDLSERRLWGEVKRGYVRFQDGDVLFAKITPCMENGKVIFVSGLLNGIGAGSTEFHVLRASEALFPKFLTYCLLQDDIRREARHRMTGTAGQLRVPAGFLQEQTLGLPPLPEQHRIVEAIESYFTRLDAAVATLERVKANLKRYRASVLKAAVEGRLVATEAELARREGRTYEPASVLLERVLKERRRRWEEAELAKLKATGKTPKDDGWKKKYKEPAAPDTSQLPELPEAWCWATIDQLGDVSGGLTQNSKRNAYPLKYPFLRVVNVYAGELRLDETLDIGVHEGEVERVLLKKHDLLVVEGNGSIEQIGRVALWDGSIEPCLHQNHLIKVRFDATGLARWALTWLLSLGGRSQVMRAASSTSGLHTLSLSKVGALPVPLCPLKEMSRVALDVDDRLSIVCESDHAVRDNLTRTKRLRQSILRWAFEGKLVDQDPADEPAFALLEQIKAERQRAEAGSKMSPGAGRKRKTA